ncbi:hypothetical protein PH213_22145 [Streptomyces sp. SRF1]|uniref:hypothetical protein n=1 Tax=Streptomyces sp. SRF1 TaxID=1549642 RepID=UPI0025B151B1|nr:hypothetical protein [Streptomyces sp. SRF1]MDN3057199.1 hypothetical protein [Streptomyces sp. SRF1]
MPDAHSWFLPGICLCDAAGCRDGVAGARAGAGVRFGAGAGGQGSGEAGEESQGVAALDGSQVLAEAGEAERRRLAPSPPRRLAAEQRDAIERVIAGWDPDERRQFARYLIRCRQDSAAWSAHQHQQTREEADGGGGAGWRQHSVLRFASW